jgi:hypothetical protein
MPTSVMICSGVRSFTSAASARTQFKPLACGSSSASFFSSRLACIA